MAQSDGHRIDDQEVVGLILTRSMQIHHEIFSTVILSLPLIQESCSAVSFWRKNVHKYWLAT